jgi:lipoprotein signal peptidase
MTIADDIRATRRWSPQQRQRALLGVIAVAVLAVDQAGKALAWRSYHGTVINPGGFYFLGDTVRGWFAHPLVGSLSDCIAWLLLAVAAWWVQRRRRGRLVLIGAALVMAGFASNLADRVGLHRVTAPGSGRGVVDFIPSGGTSRSNIADLAIATGVVLMMIALGGWVRTRRRAGRADAATAEA